MLDKLKQNWQRLKQSEPGERFEERYRRKQQSDRSRLQEILVGGGGILLCAAGVFFLFVPGPGLVVLAIGAGLVAQESLRVAHALDWAEVQVRRVYAALKRLWQRSSLSVRMLLVIVALAVVAAFAYAAYRLLFS